MPKSKFAKRYPKEFRHKMVELHRAGRMLTDLFRQIPRHGRSAAGPNKLIMTRVAATADGLSHHLHIWEGYADAVVPGLLAAMYRTPRGGLPESEFWIWIRASSV